MANPAKTLKDILAIIGKDVKRIKTIAKTSQLDPQDALTLTRYAAALDDIATREEKTKEQLKRQFKGLKTEELIKAFQESKR